jgi:antitoxin YefM
MTPVTRARRAGPAVIKGTLYAQGKTPSPAAGSPELSLARDLAHSLAMVILSLAEAKDKLSAVVSDVTSTHEHYTITRNGRSVAVVLPIEDLESLEETIFWLEREIARLRAGEPAAEGPDVSGEEMAAIMERRRREIDPA